MVDDKADKSQTHKEAQDSGDEKMSISGLILHLVDSPRRSFSLFLLTILLAGAALLTVIGIVAALRYVHPGVAIEVTPANSFRIQTPGKMTSFYLYSPHAGNESPWVDTGIEISDKHDVHIRASGKVCLALHHMVDAAKGDSLPSHPWVGPEGFRARSLWPPHKLKREDFAASQYLMMPIPDNERLAQDPNSILQGRLIGFIVPSSKDSNEPPSPFPAGDQVLDIGSGTVVRKDNVPPGGGRLWLAINEVWLLPANKEAYRLKYPDPAYQKNVADNKYWNIWFDDNAGSFLVSVEQ